jgi:polyribonucleotide nucleotidyltransferase
VRRGHDAPPGRHLGRLARLADGSCTLRCGDTLLLATVVCAAGATRYRDAPSPPLEVEYREKAFAVGRIPSTYNKREGAAREGEVLAGQRLERAVIRASAHGRVADVTLDAALSVAGVSEAQKSQVNALRGEHEAARSMALRSAQGYAHAR